MMEAPEDKEYTTYDANYKIGPWNESLLSKFGIGDSYDTAYTYSDDVKINACR